MSTKRKPHADLTHPGMPAAKETWVTCPECRVGKGTDHNKTCSRRSRVPRRIK